MVGLVVAFAVNCTTAFIAICMATLLRAELIRLNAKLDRGDVVEGAVVNDEAVGEDRADGEARKGFRFLY